MHIVTAEWYTRCALANSAKISRIGGLLWLAALLDWRIASWDLRIASWDTFCCRMVKRMCFGKFRYWTEQIFGLHTLILNCWKLTQNFVATVFELTQLGKNFKITQQLDLLIFSLKLDWLLKQSCPNRSILIGLSVCEDKQRSKAFWLVLL